MLNTWLSVYLDVLNGLIVATAFVILVSGLDDLVIDTVFWAGEFKRRVIQHQPRPTLSADALRAREERWFAIMVPAWHESDVIANMIENTLETLDYSRYVVFLGTYRNDPATAAEADKMVARDPAHIHRAIVDADGPTCKADCLNWILRAIADYEWTHGMQFAGVLMHDCEDVIHPMELKYFNDQIDNYDLIQLPVASLDVPASALIAGTYLDDFAEVHQKDVIVRQKLTGLVPGAGVALCYSRQAIGAAMAEYDGSAFNTGTLTEDYDFSFRLAALGFNRQTFAHTPLQRVPARRAGDWWQRSATATGLLVTCEYFPSTFRTAYRQRARWILGIAFLGWQQLRWRGGFLNKYMFFRDRKGIVTAPFSMLAYFVLANTLVLLMAGKGGGSQPLASHLVLYAPWLWPVLVINTFLLANRLFERIYFVTRLDGVQQGLLSIPRTILNNFINFSAVSRAWHQYASHLITGESIAWDKTSHTYPTTAELVRHRRRLGEILVEHGVITAAELESAVALQHAHGVPLGQLLIESGRLTPEILADSLAEQADLPRVHHDTGPVHGLAGAIPREIIRRHHVVPFAKSDEDTLQVAVAVLPDAAVTRRIHAVTGMHVTYIVACDYEVAQWVADAAPDDVQLAGTP